MGKSERLSLSERFWSKVDRRGPDDCWLWLGAQTGLPNATHKYGYLGRTPASTAGPFVPPKRAHVASWELHNGPVPDGLVVCHRCDVTLCVNPRHLFVDSPRGNNLDRSVKGRSSAPRGESNPNRKLTQGQVAEIRTRHQAGETQTSLAREFGVIQPHISRIVRGESWTFGDRPEAGQRRRVVNRTRKLSDEQVGEMRRRYHDGEKQVALALEFGVTQSYVSWLVRQPE